jgi:dihydroorotate dehydrogenase electron transfer subunit
VAFDGSPERLRGLIGLALRQDAAVVLVSDSAGEAVPDEVEVQPLSALTDILEWTDYVAMDVRRENLRQLKERSGRWKPGEAQILIRTPVPCGGIAECGVCAVTLKDEWKLACKDGPVFDWREI